MQDDDLLKILARLPIGNLMNDEDRSFVERAASDFIPGEEVSLRIAMRALREEVVPAIAHALTLEQARAVDYALGAMLRAAAYIHERRLYVKPAEAP